MDGKFELATFQGHTIVSDQQFNALAELPEGKENGNLQLLSKAQTRFIAVAHALQALAADSHADARAQFEKATSTFAAAINLASSAPSVTEFCSSVDVDLGSLVEALDVLSAEVIPTEDEGPVAQEEEARPIVTSEPKEQPAPAPTAAPPQAPPPAAPKALMMTPSDVEDIVKIQSMFRGGKARGDVDVIRREREAAAILAAQPVEPIVFSEDQSAKTEASAKKQNRFSSITYDLKVTPMSKDTSGMQEVYTRLLKTSTWW